MSGSLPNIRADANRVQKALLGRSLLVVENAADDPFRHCGIETRRKGRGGASDGRSKPAP
jgi:hypothetical protein